MPKTHLCRVPTFSCTTHINSFNHQMACPIEIEELYDASASIYEAFLGGFPQNDSPRQDLIYDFEEMEKICYVDYFNNIRVPAVAPQDNWLPIINRIRDNINQFQDSVNLRQVLDDWERAHQAYRGWVGRSGLDHMTLARFWF